MWTNSNAEFVLNLALQGWQRMSERKMKPLVDRSEHKSFLQFIIKI